MQIIQATFGTFHAFDLARELYSRHHLKQIYSTYPWARLKREDLPRAYVSTFPWIHTLQLGLGRFLPLPKRIDNEIALANGAMFDDWVLNKLKPCDAYIALTGSGKKSGKRAQELGAKYICDRGSSHLRYQCEIMADEYRRWGVLDHVLDPSRFLEREETEYENADAITVLSEFARRSFIECGVPAAKLHKFLLGVRLDRFHPTGEPPSGSFDILFAGAVSFRKGIPYLLEAFRRLKHPRKRLRLVGSVTREILSFLKTQDLSHVEMLGPLPQPELAKQMSKSHVLVLPSVEDGFGMVMPQAMACGCPVISTVNTGGPDLYNDREAGFHVPIRSPEAILQAMQQLADDPGLQQRMSHAAQERTKAIGGWHEYGENYTGFLQQLCGIADPVEP